MHLKVGWVLWLVWMINDMNIKGRWLNLRIINSCDISFYFIELLSIRVKYNYLMRVVEYIINKEQSVMMIVQLLWFWQNHEEYDHFISVIYSYYSFISYFKIIELYKHKIGDIFILWKKVPKFPPILNPILHRFSSLSFPFITIRHYQWIHSHWLVNNPKEN